MTQAPSLARKVPFNTLRPGVQAMRPELDAAIARVLDSGWFLMGAELDAFERAFAAYHGLTEPAIGVGSGTDAIHIGLRALGVQPGDEVLVPANAGVPPVAATVAAGAVPVFCDVDPHTFGLDPARVAPAITPRTRTIVVVHLYGQPAAVDAIMRIAAARGVRVLEDCAQAHGARLNGQLVGTFGDAAAFSFYPTKNLGALGDGGAILTRDPAVGERARLLRVYGWRERYLSEVHSTVSRLSELQAAVLSVRLRHLEEGNAARRRLAARYQAGLSGAPVLLPPPGGVFHLFVIRSAYREALRAFLAERGIDTDVHYPLAADMQPAYRQFGRGPLPVTAQLTREVLSLPLYPELAEADVDYVVEQVRAFAARRHGA
ncbi:MAG: DegT/DnrJ/EryC1/StrS family aminotransferase [Chloroflexota bacterium]|nr:DegT/DnrJ/EryC1/StrS family aminotransferase [Chloroflexota bacterium]